MEYCESRGHADESPRRRKTVLMSCALVASAVFGCQEAGLHRVVTDTKYLFVNHRHEAEVRGQPLDSQRFLIHRESRPVMFQHPKSTATFRDVPIHDDARLRFGVAVRQEAWEKPGDGVEFELRIRVPGEGEKTVFERYIDPKNRRQDRRWFEAEVDLAALTGKRVSFVFVTRAGPSHDSNYDWAGWVHPRIESRGREVAVRSVDHRSFVLITADTLRSDALGAYGQPRATTPVLDSLAAEGTLFENAFSPASITLPSHASILTSRYIREHGVTDNKMALDPGFETLAESFRRDGYRTAAFVSAPHLDPEVSGFDRGFDDFHPCRCSPRRVAAETNDLVFRWLADHYDEPFFVWIHYFDPHEVYSTSSPWSHAYYDGDPTARTHDSMLAYDRAREAYGDWVLAQVEAYLDGEENRELEQWLATLARRRDSTGEPPGLRSELDAGDRLLEDITQARASDGIPAALADELRELAIESLRERRRDPERELWLRGITDLEWTRAQYLGAVSYLDSEIGRLIDRLKEYGIWEGTTLAFTADHGEALGEHDIFFRHRGLYDEVTHVPLILRSPDLPDGIRVSRLVSGLDVMPTILELAGLEGPDSMRGRSLVELAKGRVDESVAQRVFIERGRSRAVAVRTPRYKLIRDLRSSLFTHNTLSERTIAGRVQLFDLVADPAESSDISDDRPRLAAELDARLEPWKNDPDPVTSDRSISSAMRDKLRALGYLE